MTQKASVRMEEIRRRTRRLRQRRAHRINCALSAVCLFLRQSALRPCCIRSMFRVFPSFWPGTARCCCTAALMLISWSASAPLSPALYSRCSASGTGSTKHCTAPSPRMLQTRLPPKASLTTSSALHALLPHTFLHTPKRLCRFSRQSLFPFNQKQHAETERRAVFSGSMVICPTCRTRR